MSATWASIVSALMSPRFGDRATFAVEFGAFSSPALQIADLWAGGKHLTVDDNTAYLPYFRRVVRETAARVREIRPNPWPGRTPLKVFRALNKQNWDFRSSYRFLEWDETVDNVTMFAYLEDGDVVLVFAYWRPTHPRPEELRQVFVATMNPAVLTTVLEQAADEMDRNQSVGDEV